VDGWQLKVVDLYNEPTLYVRSPESDAEQKFTFTDDDPYYNEIAAFIDAAEMGHKSRIENDSALEIEDEETDDGKIGAIQQHDGILSSFRDACGTYGLTWYVTLI
jgi:hypothetical protein